jgi:nicotinate-nucleotide adenylyltransferase
MRVAVFGGSFNPPHVGHVLAVTYALATQNLDEVLVVPVYAHPFDKDLAPFPDRVEMARLAFGDVARTRISSVESELALPSLTIRTLEHLRREHPEWELHLLVGSDVLLESSRWTDWPGIERCAKLVVLGRVHAEHPDAPKPLLPDVSSTRIRALLRVRASDPKVSEELAYSVPRTVLEYVDAHGLYR